MHSPEDHVDPRAAHGYAAPPPAAPAPKDTAGWQALYAAMLGHITGNVETWLRNYLAEMMAGAHGPSAVPQAPGSGAAIKFVIPPWLEPFNDPDNVRFTRTPDHILVQERSIWTQLLATNDDGVPFGAAPDASSSATPAERRPYVLPPNVRNSRTPDRLLAAKYEPARAAEPDAVPGQAEVVAVSEVPMDALVADAFETARAVERTEEEILATAAAVIEEAWAEVAPQPWGDVIQLGPVEVLPPAAEQGNARDALASFLMRWSEQLPPSFEQVDLGEGGSDAAGSEPVAETAEAVAPTAVADVEPEAVLTDTSTDPGFEPVTDAAAAPVETAAAEEPVTVEFLAAEVAPNPIAAEPAAEPAEVAVEAIVPVAVALPDNALHLSFLGAPKGPRLVRRPRVTGVYERPPLALLSEPVKQSTGTAVTRDSLEQNARLLEGVLEDFGIRGEIINVRPGPVVTLYELEPAPGIKSSRVVGLADDIARSMSAVSARVAVVQGRNAIGIELPNQRRDTVFLRELIGGPDFEGSPHKLAIALGKTIGGEPVVVDLARMPHLLVAGTTGSGKSVAINTMILSLLYRLRPDECRLIMVDPKMLELSIYDGIPHLLTPVVTDPKKAVVALKWAVREMEDRYKKMSKVGVRNIDGFNARVAEARAKGETIVRSVHTGFDRNTGQATYANEEMDLTVLPYIVVIVDEMADLMMVAGKDIEGAIQRLAQMARAAGIHLIMATQRPSVDVITGTIKANFPTRISFQVTSKIDSRTILGEQGAEQLLGQGDMLHMMGGGRIARVHGPFVSDAEVEAVVAHLKAQGTPDYLDVTTEDGEEGAAAEDEVAAAAGEDGAVFDRSATGAGMGAGTGEDAELYDQAVKIVLRDKKCSTSYIQRRLSVGYNKAASLVEKMEKEGIVGPANHAGKREILIYSRDVRTINISLPDEDDDVRD